MVCIALLLSVKILIFIILPRITLATVLKCFKHYPNYYLSKNENLVIVNISSITSCLDHCLKSQLLYEFICRSAMVNKMQGECVLSKWSPNLARFNNYQSKVIYTDFYQNICLSPWDQIPHFTVAPPRTTFSVPISNQPLLIQNSDDHINKNYKSIDTISDIIFNGENKKKPSFKIVFHRTKHIPSPNTTMGSINRLIKSTVAPNKKTSYYADYDKDRSDNSGNNNDCDDSNDDDNDDDYDDDDNNDGDDGDIYNDDSYKESDTGSDTQLISVNKDITYRIDSNQLISAKSAAIRPSPITNRHNLQSPLVKINSTVLFPSTTIITPLINVDAATTHTHITTIMTTVTVTITTTITTITTSTSTTTTTTTATTTTTTTIPTTTIPTTSTSASIISTSQFIPFSIDKLVPEWNTTTKDSELSIEHQNYTINIEIIQQTPENREMIRNGLNEQLKCFHHFANNRLNNYEQEIIKHIGLQDCLNNCILRVAFLCLSECILNGGNRFINNVQLIPSTSIDYYEYVCLSARKQGSKARNANFGHYNITKLRKCFTILENAVMYTLNGLVLDNVYTPLECLMTCDRSVQLYKAKCYSVNWFKNTRTCYLHTAKTNISDLKATISSDFFINNCYDTDMILERNTDCDGDYCGD